MLHKLAHQIFYLSMSQQPAIVHKVDIFYFSSIKKPTPGLESKFTNSTIRTVSDLSDCNYCALKCLIPVGYTKSTTAGVIFKLIRLDEFLVEPKIAAIFPTSSWLVILPGIFVKSACRKKTQSLYSSIHKHTFKY